MIKRKIKAISMKTLYRRMEFNCRGKKHFLKDDKVARLDALVKHLDRQHGRKK